MDLRTSVSALGLLFSLGSNIDADLHFSGIKTHIMFAGVTSLLCFGYRYAFNDGFVD